MALGRDQALRGGLEWKGDGRARRVDAFRAPPSTSSASPPTTEGAWGLSSVSRASVSGMTVLGDLAASPLAKRWDTVEGAELEIVTVVSRERDSYR